MRRNPGLTLCFTLLLGASFSTVANAGSATLFALAISPDPIAVGGTTTITYEIDNSGSSATTSGLFFTHSFSPSLPAVMATPANASTTCTGGTLTANPGGAGMSYSGGETGPSTICTVQVDVTVSSAGSFTTSTSDLDSAVYMPAASSATGTLVVNAASVPVSSSATEW